MVFPSNHPTSVLLPPPFPVESKHAITPNHRRSWGQPRPVTINQLYGMLNIRSVVNKAPLLHSLNTDLDLSILALTESCIKTDDSPAIKNSSAPPGYRITHVHRDNPDQTRGGGLAGIHRDTIDVQPRKHKLTHSSFELQLVNIGLPSQDIVLANIYRPPSSSKSTFFEKFGSLLATLGTRLIGS